MKKAILILIAIFQMGCAIESQTALSDIGQKDRLPQAMTVNIADSQVAHSVKLEAFKDSKCKELAPGLLVADQNPSKIIAGSASFSGIEYKNNDGLAAEPIYLKVSSERSSVCTQPASTISLPSAPIEVAPIQLPMIMTSSGAQVVDSLGGLSDDLSQALEIQDADLQATRVEANGEYQAYNTWIQPKFPIGEIRNFKFSYKFKASGGEAGDLMKNLGAVLTLQKVGIDNVGGFSLLSYGDNYSYVENRGGASGTTIALAGSQILANDWNIVTAEFVGGSHMTLTLNGQVSTIALSAASDFFNMIEIGFYREDEYSVAGEHTQPSILVDDFAIELMN